MREFKSVKFAAVKGSINDWALYWGPVDWTDEKVASWGHKLSEKFAREIAHLGIIDRTWLTLQYRP